ncbi:MAG: hypothetical protein ABSE70_05025 [Candidatus Limnocylindrales bacterium]
MLDQLNREYTQADISRAVEVATGLEGEDSLEAVAKALWAKAEEIKDTEPRVAELLAGDVWVCELQLTTEERQASGASALVPKMTFTNGTTYPPYVREWPDTVRPYFLERAASTTLQQTRARYNDFVWIRWGVFPNASAARDAYLAIGCGNGFRAGGKAARTILELGRAIFLSQSLNLKRAETAVIIADELD